MATGTTQLSNPISFDGGVELEKLLKTFPDKVQLRVRRAGLRRAAAKFRTLLRREAPKRYGNLRKSIKIKVHRNKTVSVGLKERFYYKTLDYPYPDRGNKALRPWFEDAIDHHKRGILQLIVQETNSALMREAGKAYSQSMSKLRRR